MNLKPPKLNAVRGLLLERLWVWVALLCCGFLGGSLLWRQGVRSGSSNEGGSAATAPGVNAPDGVSGQHHFFEEPPRGEPLVGQGRRNVSPALLGDNGGGGAVPASAQRGKGRVASLRPSALKHWANLEEGQQVVLPRFGDEPLWGTVHLRMEDNGWLRFGGALEDEEGSFTLNWRAGEVNGAILLPGVGVALEIRTESGGAHRLIERPLSAWQCWPAMGAAVAATTAGVTVATTTDAGVPQVNTKPGARGLIYINFEGGVVADPAWNYGRQIVYAPAALTTSGMWEVIERVAEDYAPFDIAISTIPADYLAAPVGRRTRILVTPTTTALPNSGGVAMINAWSAAGRTMSSTVPGWVFTSTPKQIAEGVSHEAGHTLGLNHDGTETPDGRPALAYYKGHGGDLNEPLSWAPIMGESYTRSQTHWSRGEYAAANNREDDIAIIRRKANGVGYIDDSLRGVRALEVMGGSFEVSAVLHSGDGSLFYTFATSGGILNASARPQVAKYGNTDLKLEVSDSAGRVWAVSDPVAATAAQVLVALPEGTYSIVVSAGNTGPKPWDGYRIGYPSYGAIGRFVLSGTLTNPAIYPDLTSASAAVGIVGQPFEYRPQTTEGAAVVQCVGGLYFGVDWDSTQRVLKGTPLMEGVYAMDFLIRDGAREVSRTLKITVHSDDLPVLVTGTTRLPPATTPESPWRAQLGALPWASAPSSNGVMAVSGFTGDAAASRLRYHVPAGAVVNFWWKVSSEADCDFLECRVNGALARDRDTGAALQISGVRDWSRQCVQVEGASVLEFVYRKDFSLGEELDRGWLAGLEIGQRPVFTKMPQAQRLTAGGTGFVLEAQVQQATGLQWKKDGVSVVDFDGPGRRVSGARSAVLSVSGANAADSGIYVLEARNAFGVQSSRRAEVGVPGAAVITQKIAAGGGVRVGDTLLLTVGVACAKPYFVVWSKNGVPFRWTQSTLLQLREADASMSGRYSAVVVNAYGSVSAGEVSVQVW